MGDDRVCYERGVRVEIPCLVHWMEGREGARDWYQK